MLQILLTLPGALNVFVTLKMNETLQTVSLGEAVYQAFPVLPSSAREIISHADIQRAVPPVCDDVNPSRRHLGNNRGAH
jgi:hypothetical protein